MSLSHMVSSDSGAGLDRVCWVCLETESHTVGENWCHPCRCRGATKWVHRGCLQRWIDEQQSSPEASSTVSCRVCKTQYEIIYPPDSLLYLLLAELDRRTHTLAAYMTVGIVSASVYWAAVAYGAVTVMQVWGHHVGLRAMMDTDPLLLLLALPSVPACLLLGKLIPFSQMLRSFWRRCLSRLRPVQWLLKSNPPTWPIREGTEVDVVVEGHDYLRHFCSALALPTLASMIGRVVFHRVSSNFRRVVLGGMTYLGVQGILAATYQELRYMRTCYRQVKDYCDDK